MTQWLRWLLILPTAVAVWYLCLLLGLLLLSVVNLLCPDTQMISGACIAPWYPLASRAVICTGAALAAALIVLSATILAPSHKLQTAFVVLCAGTLVAITMAFAVEAVAELICAVVAGSAVALAVRSYDKNRAVA